MGLPITYSDRQQLSKITTCYAVMLHIVFSCRSHVAANILKIYITTLLLVNACNYASHNLYFAALLAIFWLKTRYNRWLISTNFLVTCADGSLHILTSHRQIAYPKSKRREKEVWELFFVTFYQRFQGTFFCYVLQNSSVWEDIIITTSA